MMKDQHKLSLRYELVAIIIMAITFLFPHLGNPTLNVSGLVISSLGTMCVVVYMLETAKVFANLSADKPVDIHITVSEITMYLCYVLFVCMLGNNIAVIVHAI